MHGSIVFEVCKNVKAQFEKVLKAAGRQIVKEVQKQQKKIELTKKDAQRMDHFRSSKIPVSIQT